MLRIWVALGLLAAWLPGSASASVSGQEQVDGYTLNFVDADAQRVVDAVLGSMLGADYSIDPAVTGNVTLRTGGPVPAERLVPLLENALQPIGAVIIEEQGRYRVVPRDRAITSLGDGSTVSRRGFSSEVLTIRVANTERIADLVREFVGDDVVSEVEPALNRITISGNAEERRAARQIVERFDQSAFSEMRFEMVRLDLVDPDTLVAELNEIYQPPYDYIGTRIRVIPLSRLKSVLLIAADQNDIAAVQQWIERLDAGVGGKRRLFSYAVQYGRARDLAATLQQVLPGGAEGDIAPPTAQPVITSAEPGERSGPPTPPPLSPPPSTGGPRVVPNEETNSLLIYADGEEFEFIRDALARLDQPVPQVMIEAILAEVTLTDDFQYGLNFQLLSGDIDVVNSNFSSGTPTSQFPGFSASWIGSTAGAVLNAIEARTNVQVLSAPKLFVLNNQTATLQVGDQVPVITSQVQGVISPGAPIVNNVELRDTGVILEVTPRVNDSGAVTFDIVQEVSDVAETTTSGINSPTIQQRRISTTVTTRSGEMVALGGLIREREVETKSGIPLLSQIPIVGGLFGQRKKGGVRTELVILLTPTVLRRPEDVRNSVDDLLDAMDKAGPIARDGTRIPR